MPRLKSLGLSRMKIPSIVGFAVVILVAGIAYPPGSWFDRVDPKEQEAFEAARKAFERARLGR